jgi:GntR family transcriptional repressor for pyruvate dehydrogenase complex
MVADRLRDQIVDGELVDELAPMEQLVAEFGVSAPSIREALRILEHEGLITVRRGKVGGAVVHRPQADAAGYAIGLVLQADRVHTADLRAALAELEPVCASLCAQRADRRRAVVPKLHDACERMADAIDDPKAMEPWSRRFHAQLIEGSGNRTLVLVVGALEKLWSSQQEAWTQRVAVADQSPDVELRKQGLLAHRRITAAIDAGDAAEAAHLVRDHMHDPRIYAARRRGPVIKARP